jgi:hypothetical protein
MADLLVNMGLPMNEDQISSGEKSSAEDRSDHDAVLGLELIKGFQRLDINDKLKVIEIVNELASSRRSDEA